MRGTAAQSIVILSLLAATGCSGYRAPTVTIENVTLGGATAEAVQIEFDLLLGNPNAKPLELEEIRYTLAVDGERVYEGRRAAGVNLSALGEQRISLPAIIPARDDAGLVAYTLRGSLRYRTPGQIAQRLFDTGVRRPKTGFRHEGTVEVPDLSQLP